MPGQPRLPQSPRRHPAPRPHRHRRLLRDGLDRLLTEAGFGVAGKAGTARRAAPRSRAGAARTSRSSTSRCRLPTGVGLVAAREIRVSHPDVGVLVLSHYLESHYAMLLIEQHSGGTGYLLKERVSGVGVLARGTRVTAWSTRRSSPGCRAAPARPARSASSPNGEREVLALMAERRSNKGICERMFWAQDGRGAREKHLHQARRRRVRRRSPPRARDAQLPAVTAPQQA